VGYLSLFDVKIINELLSMLPVQMGEGSETQKIG